MEIMTIHLSKGLVLLLMFIELDGHEHDQMIKIQLITFYDVCGYLD
jgi:hypothetical protein